MNFKTYNLENAPDASKPLLKQIINEYGFIPNLYEILAESAPALKGLLEITDSVSKAGFTLIEQQVM